MRRCHRRKRDCEALRTVWKRLCAVCGKICKIHKGCNPGVKNDHQFKKRKPSVKEPFVLSQTVFLFLASEALFCRKCFRLVVTHPVLPDGCKLASRLPITFRTETLFLLLPQTRYNLTVQLNDVPVPALLPALRTRKLHAFLLVCCNMPDINSPDINVIECSCCFHHDNYLHQIKLYFFI